MKLTNVACIALLAALTEQLMHEGTHALAVLLVGANLDAFHFWAVAHSFVHNPGSEIAEAIIAGSAALVDILVAALCLVILRTRLAETTRLFVFYFAAFCLFSGFGYLMVDPIIANSESHGDWAKVVMLLGGEWTVRVPIILVGAAGIVFGFFWFGRNALHIQVTGYSRKNTGLATCIMPYLLICSVFSIMSIWHPLGSDGMVAVMMKFWMGYIGFFWGFMIVFVWDSYMPPEDRTFQLSGRLNLPVMLVLCVSLIIVAYWLTLPIPEGLD
jgi:hypothetical protein